MEEIKKQKIINAGFQIFADHGYTKASVDEIVKVADISKGSLFYYFESKKNFYLYLYENCGKIMEKLIDSPGPDGRPSYMAYTDFFERLNAIQILKLKHSIEYPHMSGFMKKAVLDTSPTAKELISKINIKYVKERTMRFLEGLDYSRFKEGIDPMMVLQLLSWTSEGCANQVILRNKMNPDTEKSSPDFNEILRLNQSYIEMFRKNFYKEEYVT